MKKLFRFEKITPAILTLALPLMASAQASSGILDFLNRIRTILNYIIGILFVLVTLYFIWGIVTYVMAGGDEKKIETGKKHMIYGLIGMAVMAGAWGIVTLILNSFGVSTGTGNVNVPTFQF